MPFGIKVGKNNDFRPASFGHDPHDAKDGEEIHEDHQKYDDDHDRRRELEESLSSVDELQDFETFDPTDLIYREYEPVILADSSHYERFDRLGQFSWKTGRPPIQQSLIHSAICTLQTTFITGCLIGALLSIVVFLDANLVDVCYGYSNSLGSVPAYIKRIKLVSDMTSSIITQFWHLLILYFVFGFEIVKESRILSWNLLAGLLAGMYKLIYGLFLERDVFWRGFPSCGIFIFVATFNSLRVSNTLNASAMGHSPYLVMKLISQFAIGLPVIFIFTVWINPSYKEMDDPSKVAFACFVPLIIAIPKMVLRKSVEFVRKVNHPGTTFYLLVAFYTSSSLLLRTLQVQVDGFPAYITLSILYGALSTVERAILPYLDFLQHKFFRGKKRSLAEFMTPRHNRLMSDLTLTSMITEPAMIFVSCTTMAMLQFYYGHDKNGNIYKINFLCIVATKRIATALSMEMIFNFISLKVESYYFNMPVMKVWKLKRLWISFTIMLSAVIAVMCFSHIVYDALSTADFFDGTLICSPPFSRPIVKINQTLIQKIPQLLSP